MSQRALSRRRFLYMSGGLAAGGALATQGSLVALASHRDTPADNVTLTFWWPGGGCGSLPFSAMTHDYERRHPSIHIPQVQCGTGKQDFITVLLARIAAGSPPDAAFIWDTPVSLAARGALEPLDALMAHSPTAQKSRWPASALASCQFNGQTWGLPYSGGSFAFFYNQDWFAKKGIPTSRDSFPKTWDDLRRLSKEFTFWKGGKLVTAGFPPMTDPDLLATIYMWSALNGGQLYDAHNRKYTIDAESNIAMMEYMVAWLNAEYKGDMIAVQRGGNWSYAPDAQGRPPAFFTGRQAMVVGGSWAIGVTQQTLTSFRWNVASLSVGPQGTKTTSGYWPNWLIIPKGSVNKQAAFDWMDYLCSQGIRIWFQQIPDLPANKTVPASLLPTLLVQAEGKAFALDYMRFFYHQLDIATPMWNSPVQSFATDQITNAVNRIMHKVAKPKEALAEAQQASQNQLNQVLHSS